MNQIPLYIDSSVVGGYFDAEFEQPTRELWTRMKQGQFRFVASVLLFQEIEGAPSRVRELLKNTFPNERLLLPITADAVRLADAYLRHKIVPAVYADDARHVAIATVSGISLIVSWNFKHLVNLRREAGFNGVNLLQGRPSIRIVSPLQLIYGDEKEI